jgi:hypothetical protein
VAELRRIFTVRVVEGDENARIAVVEVADLH